MIYPDSFDLLTADAGILNGKLAVSFSYFHLTSFGKRDWVVRAYTCSENGRVSTFYTWDSNVNYTSMIKLDTSLIMME